eukprot:CAMPEP_0172921132 /NCGR_PEP_ID=MMETSP1075-20121228/205318_1 /TAXON_ID=2916 /ORGANISM="Ceratium fusus, Strain PA161109" /LENGTH=353 /DNA_ID=CAMNT_0013781251 /DNA_START=55 /DNA_END=1112 /DNA_ORIENTATION=+
MAMYSVSVQRMLAASAVPAALLQYTLRQQGRLLPRYAVQIGQWGHDPEGLPAVGDNVSINCGDVAFGDSNDFSTTRSNQSQAQSAVPASGPDLFATIGKPAPLVKARPEQASSKMVHICSTQLGSSDGPMIPDSTAAVEAAASTPSPPSPPLPRSPPATVEPPSNGHGVQDEGETLCTASDDSPTALPVAPVTTLEVRNLPDSYNQEVMMGELESLGLVLGCNYIIVVPYLEMSWSRMCAFVNFWTPEDAEHARVVLAGHVWQIDQDGGSVYADVVDASIQGYEALVQQFSLSPILLPEVFNHSLLGVGNFCVQSPQPDVQVELQSRGRTWESSSTISRTPSHSPEPRCANAW